MKTNRLMGKTLGIAVAFVMICAMCGGLLATPERADAAPTITDRSGDHRDDYGGRYTGEEGIGFTPGSITREVGSDSPTGPFDDYFVGKTLSALPALAFFSNRDGNDEIYVMNSDGSGQTNLSNNPGDDWDPSWSPDGSRIALESWRDGNAEIYVMNADGSNQSNLTNNLAEDSHPDWSPDGTKIVFCSSRDNSGGNCDIYVMNADGSNPVNLTNTSGHDWYPSWSPDGTEIAFSSDQDGDFELYVMKADGSNLRKLTSTGKCIQPTWSPDGSQIAFARETSGARHIYVMSSDGSNWRQLTTGFLEDNRDPNWFPGDRIAFASNRLGNFEIYVMNPDGSSQTRLTSNTANDFHPAWLKTYAPPPSLDLLGAGARWAAQTSGGTALYVNWQDNLYLHPNPEWGSPLPTGPNSGDSISYILEAYGFDVEFAGDIPADLSEYSVVVITAYWAVEPTNEPTIASYISDGGGVVLTEGVPCYFVTYCKDWDPGIGSLASIQDWFGAGWYTNTGGYAQVAIDNPFGTSLSEGDILVEGAGPSCGAISQLQPGGETIAQWGTGYIFSFAYETVGRLYYQSVCEELPSIPDTVPPTVSDVSPEDSAGDVPIGTNVTATFSEPVDGSTITAESFGLAGSTVTGTVIYDPATYTATFTPDAALDYNHTYTAALTTAITDLAGNPLAESYSWSFTTQPFLRIQFDFSNLQDLFVFPWSGKIREIEFVDEKAEYSPGDTVKVRVQMENTGQGNHKYSVKLYILDPTGEIVHSEEISSDEYVNQGDSFSYGPFQYALPKKSWPWEKDAIPGNYHVLARLSAKFAGVPEDSWIADLIPSFAVDYMGIDDNLAPPEATFQVTGDDGGEQDYEDGTGYKTLADEIRNFKKTIIPVCIPIKEDIGETALVLAIDPLADKPIQEEYERVIVKIDMAEETWSTLEEVAPASAKQVDLYASTPASLSGSIKTFFARLCTKLLPNVWEQLINDAAWDIVKTTLGWNLPPFLEDILWPGLKGRYETIVREDAAWGETKQNTLYLPVNTPINISVTGGILVFYPPFLLPIPQVLRCVEGQQEVLIPEDPNESELGVIEISLTLSMSQEDLIEALENVIQVKIASPGELRVYDFQDRVTGSVDGEAKQEIPISTYDAENCMVTVFSAIDSYRYEIVGTEEGTYGLEAVLIKEGEPITFVAADIPTSPNAVHQYTINWDALFQGEEGVTVQIDSDGDGIFERTITSGGELTGDEFVLKTATIIDFDPNTLNLQDKGKYVTVYIELPPGYNVTQIDVSGVALNGTVPALAKPTQIGDYDKDGIPDLMVKFDAPGVKSLLAAGDQVQITITGQVAGIAFEGSDTIRVISPQPWLYLHWPIM